MNSRALARLLICFGALAASLAQTGAQAASDTDTALGNAAQYAPGVSADVVKAACREQSVMLYTLVLHDNSREVFKQFQARFPCVTVKTFAASGGALMQRFTSEFRVKSNVADVWMNSSPLFGASLVSQKMLRNWTPPNDAAFSDQWKQQGYWYPVGLATLGVAWNTDAINAQQKAWLSTLKSWDQLAQAPVTSASGMVDIRAGGTTQLAYHFFAKEYGQGFLGKLAALKPSIFNGINPLVERLSAGEFPVALAITTDTAGGTQLQNGAPLEWKFPEPGLAVPYYIGVSAQAPHPNAALLLMAWSVSKDGQTAWVKSSGLAPAAKVGSDERSFAKSAWYKAPATYYRPSWPEIAGEFDADVKRFDTAFKK